MELRYCEKCRQMTNHKITKLPLSVLAECLKCEVKDGNVSKSSCATL